MSGTGAGTEIALRDVHFRYPDGPDVLHDVDLVFGPGTTALVGENGAGKSTLLRLCNGLLRPTAGEVLVAGRPVGERDTAEIAADVGLVFQHPADMIVRGRVLDEVTVGPRNLGVDAGEAEARAREALADLHLDHLADDNPHDLSYAEKKLLTVASVLAMRTGAVLLDEPTVGQDQAGVGQVAAAVATVAEAGRTVVVVSHDMAFVARTCDRVVVLAEGRVLADGAAADVYADDTVLEAAGLDVPSVTDLARRLGMGRTVLTPDELVELVSAGR